MADIDFDVVGTLSGITNPTSLTFGADERLYVTQQNGEVLALTVTLQNGQLVETAPREALTLDNGLGVVRGIVNHDDDGSIFDGEQVNAGGGNAYTDRQVTGIVASEDADGNPVFYITSSDPRISVGSSSGAGKPNNNGGTNGREDTNLDTNSGILTKVMGTPDGQGGFTWDAVDLIRGLPRSEENHSTNGMALDADSNTLYLQVGGNTNNGAPGAFFSFTAEYALSGTLLEIDLDALEALPILTDTDAGKPLTAIPGTGNTSSNVGPSNPATERKYVYDLPTLDDPNRENITDGIGENADGLDEAGPFGGNDGFNQAILVEGSPIKIFADGLRNAFDVVLTQDGKLYTVDNGSNGGLGAEPLVENGVGTNAPPELETPANFGSGDPEPLFLLERGGYYGHGAPNRGNPTGQLAILDDFGVPFMANGTTFDIDTDQYIQTTINDISTLVPASLVGTGPGKIEVGNLVDPEQFAALSGLTSQEFSDRLAESSITVQRAGPSEPTPALALLGSSTNGIAEYTGDAFDGALTGSLVVTQFNGNVTIIKLNGDGTGLAPIFNPGADGVLGTPDDVEQESDGTLQINAAGGNPLDVIVGDSQNTYSPEVFDGVIISALIGTNNINAFAPSDGSVIEDFDFDDDTILDASDPFTRDAGNGSAATVVPGQTLTWDFSDNSNNSLVGPSGYGGGLTGVATNGVDFEASLDQDAFFQFSGAPRPLQQVPLDNLKVATAAGGGLAVIEYVSNGTPDGAANTGEFLFQTGVNVPDSVDTFTIEWDIFNPNNIYDPTDTSGDGGSNATAGSFTENGAQQIGGFIGTGDQSNFLKVTLTNGTATSGLDGPGFIISLEDDDLVTQSVFIEAADVFDALGGAINQAGGKFQIALTIDRASDEAVAQITYPSASGSTTVSNASEPIDLADSNVLDAINGDFTLPTVSNQSAPSGLAVGLFSSNGGDPSGPGVVQELDAFTAIFDNITIDATGTVVGPTVEIINPFTNGAGTADGTVVAQDENLVIVVKMTDPEAIDLASISASDLVVTVNGVTVPAGDMELLSLLDDPLLPNSGQPEVDNGVLAPLTIGQDTYITFIAKPPVGGWDLGAANVGEATSVNVEATLAAGAVLNVIGGENDPASATFTTDFVNTGTQVVRAFNHGGPNKTVEGVLYEDDEAPANLFPSGLDIVATTAGGAPSGNGPDADGNGSTFGTGNQDIIDDLVGEKSATDAELFGSERSSGSSNGKIVFTISEDAGGLPLKANTNYAIQLGFAELFSDAAVNQPGIDTFGERVFDVTVNGALVLDNFDLFSRAPGAFAILEKTVLTTTDANGELIIELDANTAVGGTQQPKINASKITELPTEGGTPVVQASVADASVNEADGLVEVTFTLSEAVPGGIVTVPFTLTDITATGGADYTLPDPLNVTFDNTTIATLTIPIADEGGAPEPNESFTIAIDSDGITGPVGFVYVASGSNGTATVTIADSNVPGPAVNIVNPFAADLGGEDADVAGEVFVATDDNITIVVELTDTNGVDLTSVQATDLQIVVNGTTVPAADMELLTLFDDPQLTSQGQLETLDGQLAPVVNGDVTSLVFIAKAPAGGWDIGGAAVGTPTPIGVDATLQAESVLNTLGGGVAGTTASFITNFIDVGTDVVRAINAGGGSNGTSPGSSIVVNGVEYEDDDTVQGESNNAAAANNQATPPSGVTLAVTLADGTVVSAGGDGGVFGGGGQLADLAGERSLEEAQLFATERFTGNQNAKLTYTITEDGDGAPLDPNGTYAIELSFAEIFFDSSSANAGINAPGLRVFDVEVNDEVVIADLDLFARAPGTHVIVERTVLAEVVNGAITIAVDGIGKPENAKINAFKITQVATSAVDETAPVASLTVTPPANSADAVVVDLSFDEPVSDLTADEVILTVPNPNGGVVLLSNGTLVETDAQTYSVSFAAPTQGWANGDYIATLAAGSVQDAAGNVVVETTQSATLSLALDLDEIWDENVNGDLSDDKANPTAMPELTEGSNKVTLFALDANGDEALPFGSDRDYFTIVVPEGFELTQLVLENYAADSETLSPNSAFLGLAAEGETVVNSPDGTDDAPGDTNLIGGVVFNDGLTGTDLLDDMAASGGSPAFEGFTAPLPAGTYNFWLNQNGLVSSATLDFQVSAVVDLPPAFDPATPSGVNAPENSTDTFFTFAATDPNDDDIVYSISTETPADGSNDDATAFVIDPQTGALSFASGQDFEQPSDIDEDNAYKVTVVATANGQSVSQAVTVTVTDVLDTTPGDIDGDGILNIDDPFAHDGQNGLGRQLLPGGEFLQTFDTPSNDPFSTEGGFSGILVNPDFDYGVDPAGPDPLDPYGNRTNEDKVSIANGALNVDSSIFDAFFTGTGNNNTLADGYQSGVDVSGVDQFEVVATVTSEDFKDTLASAGFQQFGIALGAGGVDDFVKLVVSDFNNNDPQLAVAGSVELAHQGSFSANVGRIPLDSSVINLQTVESYELTLTVSKSVTGGVFAGTVSGLVEYFDVNGSVGTTSIGLATINPNGSLAAALQNANPLTGGAGGLAYGIFVTDDTSGGNPDFTASYQSLRITALDPVTGDALVSLAPTGSATETDIAGDPGVVSLPLSTNPPASGTSIDVLYTVNGGAPIAASIALDAAGNGTIDVPVTSDNTVNGNASFDIVLTEVTTAGFAVNPAASTGTATFIEDDFAPVAEDDSDSVLPGGSVNIDILANDTDADDANLDVSGIVDPGIDGVMVTLNPDNTVTVTATEAVPAGPITIGYTVVDSGNNTDTGTLTVNVIDVAATAPVVSIDNPFANTGASALVASDDDIVFVVRLTDADGIDFTSINADDLEVTVNGDLVPGADMAFLNLIDDPLVQNNQGVVETDNGQIAPAVFGDDTLITFVASAPQGGWNLGGAAVAQVVALDVTAALKPGSVLDTIGVGNAAGGATYSANFIDVGSNVVRALNAGGTNGATPGETLVVNGVTYEDDDLQGNPADAAMPGVEITSPAGGGDGNVSGSANTINDILTDDAALAQLYGTERFTGNPSGTLAYAITEDASGQPLDANTVYAVELGFAEIFNDASANTTANSAPDQRVFNVLVNGDTVIEDFDLFPLAPGGHTIIERTFLTTTDGAGAINLAFEGIGKDNAKINAIKINALPATEVSLAPASTAIEGSDTDTDATAVQVTVTTSPAAAGQEVSFTLAIADTPFSTDYTVTLDGTGAAVVPFDVAGFNDDLADGDDSVTITLTGVATLGFAVSGAAATTVATVTEDDFAPAASPETASVDIAGSVSVDVTANVSDADDATGLSFALVEGSVAGTAGATAADVTDNGDGTFAVTAPAGAANGETIEFAYSVTDPGGNVATETVTVTVADNVPVSPSLTVDVPTETEGDIVVTIAFGEPVSAVGGNLAAASVSLSNTAGLERTDGLVQFTDGATSAIVTFAAPPGGFAQDVDYSASLAEGVVFDDLNNSNTGADSAPVPFAIDDAPVFVSGPEQVNLAENRDGAIATYAADDQDGDDVSYSLSQAGLDAGFSIDPVSGVLSAPTDGFDFEAGVVQFVFDVIATSQAVDQPAQTAIRTVTVDLLDLNEDGPTEFEFEDFDNVNPISQAQPGEFFEENQGAASGGKVGRLASNADGSATLTLDDNSNVAFGTNDVTVTYFDENDGVSSLNLRVNGDIVGSVTLDDDGGFNAGQASNLRTVAFRNVEIPADAVITIDGTSQNFEFLRIDKIGFSPVDDGGSTGNQAPIKVADIDLGDLTQGDTINIPLSETAQPIFVDPDEDALIFTLDPNAPDFLGIQNGALVNTREITNADAVAFANTVVSVTIEASDGNLSAFETFDVTVGNANDAPSLVDGTVTDLTFETSDSDITPIQAADFFDDIDDLVPNSGEQLSYAATGLPPELEIDPVTGEISGAVTSPGSFAVTVTAIDTGGLSAVASFTITVGGEPVLGDPVRFQVEDFDNIADPGGFFVENQGNADQNQVARLGAGGAGEALLDLSGESDVTPGSYNLKIGLFDETDGASTVIVKFRTFDDQNVPTDTVLAQFVLDVDAGGNAAQAASFREVLLPGVTLPADATLVLEGLADGYNASEAAAAGGTQGQEFVRLDYVEFVPVTGTVGNFAPFPVPGFDTALEAPEGSAVFDLFAAFSDAEEDVLTFGLAPINENTPVPPFLSIDPASGALSMQGSSVEVDTLFSFLVTATDAAGSGETASQVFTLQVLDSPLPSVSAVVTGDLTEGSLDAAVEVSLNDGTPLDGDATVRLSLAAGTTDSATPGDDLVFSDVGLATIDVTIPQGQTLVSLPLDLIDDGPVELAESFVVTIDAANLGAVIDANADQLPIGGASAEAQILDGDFAPVAAPDSESVFAGASITFDPAANDTDADLDGATLTVVAIDDTATIGGSVVLNPGDGTVNVAPDNGVTAGDIVFGYTVADQFGNLDDTGTASVSITPAPELTVSGPEDSVPEGQDAVFTLALNGAAPADVTINYTLAGSAVNDATEAVDFDATAGSVIIALGETSVPVPVTTLQDLDLESAEGLVLNVTDASFLSGGAQVAVTLTTPSAEAQIAAEVAQTPSDPSTDEVIDITDTLTEQFDFGGESDTSQDMATASAEVLQDMTFEGIGSGDKIAINDRNLELTALRDAPGTGIELVFDDLDIIGAGEDVNLRLDGPGFESVGDLTLANFSVAQGDGTTVTFIAEPITATDGRALFTANLNSGTTGNNPILGTSTFAGNSMQITNQSENGVAIAKVTIDLSNTFIPDTVFDTTSPPAGDATFKPYEQNSQTTGLSGPGTDYTVSTAAPFDNGFNQLVLEFDPGAFSVGDLLAFSIDVDPITATVGNIGGAVSGAELAGGTVTVEFEDGTSATSAIIPQNGFLGATALVQVGQTETSPLLQLGDGTTAPRVVNQADLPIRIDAGVENANGQVNVYILDTAFVNAANNDANDGNDSPNPPGGVDAIQGNNVQALPVVVTLDLDENGFVAGTIPVTRSLLQEANANGNLGFNYFAAGIVDDAGEVTTLSAPIVVEFNPDAVVDPIVPIDDFDGPLAEITAIDASASDQAIVVTALYTDASGIDPASLGADDIQVVSDDPADAPSLASPVVSGPVDNGDGTFTATYSFAALQAGWAGANFSAQILADSVADTAPGANLNSASAVVGFTLDSAAPILLRLNTSGPGDAVLVDAIDNGSDWLADDGTFFTGSQNRGDFDTTPLTPDLSGIPNEIFETARSNNVSFSYDFDVASELNAANGLFTVNLYFAEAFDTNNVPGAREFDILFEGQLEYDNFDVAAAFNQGGGVLSTVVEVTDGELNIDFVSQIDNAIVSGIEIIGGGVVPPDTAGPSVTIVGASIASASGPITVVVDLADATGIDLASIGDDDVTVTSDNAADDAALAAPSDVDIQENGNGTVTVTYTYAAPNGGWSGANFSASVNAGTISDTAADAPNTNAASAAVDFALPADQGTALSVLENVTGVDSGASYGTNATGSAILTILDGANNPETSNFGANAFQLTNTGDKQIAAVVIDFRTAVFGDSVVDFDGTAGDIAAKPFGVQDGGGNNPQTGGTGIVLDLGNTSNGQVNFDVNETYLFPGAAPLPNTTGGGNTNVSGGFRGLLLKFDGSEGGFSNGETIGFAGDMDPNSIAGLAKSGTFGVDPGSIGDPGSVWDVGGISGAELIGSTFAVLFDDGSTAVGHLGSDGSQAGSVGEAVEGQSLAVAALSISTNGEVVTSGDAGEYSAPPAITVTGPAGAIVRVTLQKGFNPVGNSNGGVDQLVANRLAVSQPDFQVNNVFDTQIVDVVIPGSGSITLASDAFDYENITNSDVAFGNSNIQPLAFTAAVVGVASDNTPDVLASDDNLVPVGPVSAPVYLTYDDSGPAVITTPNAVSISEEDALFILDVNASGDVTGFEILPIGDGGLFTIDPDTGVLTFAAAPDFENPLDGDGDNIYQVTVQANGSEGNDTQEISVEVTDQQELVEGYFEGVGSGDSFRFRIQIEDAAGGPNGGTNPNGKWNFIAEGDPDDVFTENSTGAGYYRFGSTQSTQIVGANDESGDNQLFFRIFIPENETGIYQARFRSGREDLPNVPSDQQNDVWFNLVKEDDPNSEIETYLVAPEGSEPEPTSLGYVKVFGGPQNNTFGLPGNVDGAPSNFPLVFNLEESGFYVIEVAGRSQGYFIDALDLFKQGNEPTEFAFDSPFIATGPTAPSIANELVAESLQVGGSLDVSDVFVDLDGNQGQPLAITAQALVGGQPAALPTGVNFANNVLSVSSGTAPGTITIQLTATDLDNNTATESFELTISEEPEPGDGIGLWRFNDFAPGLDETAQNNTALLQNGASVSGGQVILDGIDDYVEIPDLALYDIVDGGLRITFTADNLSGVQALWSRDSSGFDGGGHTTATLNPNGSVSVRHQTTSGSFAAESTPGLVSAGQQITLVYVINAAGEMQLFTESGNGVRTLVAENANADVDFSGNDEPWVLGASQASSGNGVANALKQFLEGSIDEFELFSGAPTSGEPNTPPTANPDTATVLEDGTLSGIAVLANDTDSDGDIPLVLAGVIQPQNGTVTTNSDGTLNYTPNADFFGVETITYTVRDARNATSNGTLTVTVTGVEDPNVANDDLASTLTETPVEIAVLANDVDPDGGDVSIVSFDAVTPNGSVTNADGVLTYTPNTAFIGTDTFNYEITGGATATVTVNVTADTPVDPLLVGQWSFNAPNATQDATAQDNSAILQNGATATGQAIDLDGINQFIEITDLGIYDIGDGGLAMTFTVDTLKDGSDNGTSSPAKALDTPQQGLFSRDSSGFDGGGHVSAWVDGDGSIVIRHQTTNKSFDIETAAGTVVAGQEISLVYMVDGGDMFLFEEVAPNQLQQLASNTQANVSFAGNDEPWTLGALQSRSGNDKATPFISVFDGSIDEFELFTGDGGYLIL